MIIKAGSRIRWVPGLVAAVCLHLPSLWFLTAPTAGFAVAAHADIVGVALPSMRSAGPVLPVARPESWSHLWVHLS